ncbi:MAG: type IV secretion system DNA-binding domain-containing protein [Roseitalea porphyridii]|uniref:type IV secretory system conjugative DNA transfer family protein n=2 Tax=Roseitalea porphyridii TaxID=1852022 RepID=UPI0032EF24F8
MCGRRNRGRLSVQTLLQHAGPMHSPDEAITILGQTVGRQPYRTFGIRQPDRLYHQYIIGQTGTGKSTLMLNMIQQDIAQGHGFCLIDPHGDLAETIAGIAGDRAIYWDAADPASPHGYNPLTHVSTELRPLVASSLIDALKKQWSDAWGPRMEHLLRYALLALLERPDATLDDILPLFLETDFRRQVVAGVTDEAVRRFWTTEFPKMNYKTTLDGVAPIANKLGAFLAHPVVKTAVCAPASPLRFRRIMDEGQMLIVNLAKGRLGPDISNLLGGLVVSMLAYAAYSRQETPEAERRPFFLYIDEFHAFTTEAFADMLSGLRKYGLGAILAHQHTSQLERAVLDAILGNVGTWIVFRVGASDASILAKQLAGDRTEARDLIKLPNYEVFVKLLIDGQQGRVFSASTDP